MFLCLGTWCLVQSVHAEETTEEQSEGKVISEISDSEQVISLTEKISYEELQTMFPSELEVTLSDGTKEQIAVTWICECDYEQEESDVYVFEALFPEGYVRSETCPYAFLIVTLDGFSSPETYRVYEANPDSNVTIDQYLGATGDIVKYLEQYAPDADGNYSTYYLSTPYYGNINRIEMNLVPNGEGADGVTCGMNCVGFVGKVLRSNGADLTKISNRLNGWYANASNWNDFVDANHIKSYRFTSISQMLESGVLQKGDIIYFEPDWTRADDDCHMGFFWGSTSNEDSFWNSSKNPSGNWITNIQSKSPIYYIYVFPVTHTEDIVLPETGSAKTILLLFMGGVLMTAIVANKKKQMI